jgi:hypothetical protein
VVTDKVIDTNTAAAENKTTNTTTLVSDGEKSTVPGGNTSSTLTSGNEKEVTVTTADGKGNKPSPVVAEPARPIATEKLDDAVAFKKAEAKDEERKDALKKTSSANNGVKERAIQDADKYKDEKNRNAAASRKVDEQYYRNQTNVFRGRVTDANNVGVPFANVTNVEDKAGTYADANGYFNLTSPDTVLIVQVRSIGFENNQTQLRNAAPTNQVVLQDDRRSLSEVVISNQKPNVAARNRDANKTLQEPEPADGWDNYNAYAANNLEIPEDLKSKQKNAGAVEVSFEVDKNGEPVNIKVEKSLCPKCDEEAKRLIKEGPKWRRAASKKGRTTVTINF